MICNLMLSSDFIIDIIEANPNKKEYLLKNISFYDMQRYMEDNEISDYDKMLYILLAKYKLEEYKINNKKAEIKNFKFLKFLDEETALEILKIQKTWNIEDVKEYVPFQSHIDYINSLDKKDKSILVRTFWKKYINIEFVPTVEKKLRNIEMLNEYPYIYFGNAHTYAESIFRNATTMGENYTGTSMGYIFKDTETAVKLINKIAEMEYLIEVQKQKVKFNTENIGRDYKYFNVPTINAIHDDEKIEFDVKAAFNKNMCSFTTKLVKDVELIGNVDDIIFCASVPLYNSNTLENEYMLKVLKEINVPLSLDRRYIPSSCYDEVMKKYREFVSNKRENETNKINEALLKKGLKGDIEFIDSGVIVKITVKGDNGFEYIATSKQKYYTSLEDTIEWIENYDESDIKETYDYRNKLNIFLAKDLPNV